MSTFSDCVRGSRWLQSVWWHELLALVMRAALVVYGEHQDRTSGVLYTDVDYLVLSDAAHHIQNGESPFDRHTYRYTPFLAWLMLPNVMYSMVLGKVLFCLLDVVAARIMYSTLLLQGFERPTAIASSLLWLYNPIVIGISTRGSAESVLAVLVLLVIYFHQKKNPVLTGTCLGTAIHFKMYPIIYCLPLYLSLESPCGKYIWERLLPNPSRVKLTISTMVSFAALTWSGYLLYGFDYIQEGFLYHVTRVDTRHNFSIYFYLLYLATDYNIPGLGVATFAPQLLLVAAYGVVYGRREHLVLAMFAQTVVFVTFNKVVTSQYFVWYLLFVPLLSCRLKLSLRKSFVLLLLWLLAQAFWLLPAYLLEFKGINVFVPIWLESVAFFCCNVGVLMAILSSYWAHSAAADTEKSK